MQTHIYDAPELTVVLRGHLLTEQVIEALLAQLTKHPDQFFKNRPITFERKIGSC